MLAVQRATDGKTGLGGSRAGRERHARGELRCEDHGCASGSGQPLAAAAAAAGAVLRAHQRTSSGSSGAGGVLDATTHQAIPPAVVSSAGVIPSADAASRPLGAPQQLPLPLLGLLTGGTTQQQQQQPQPLLLQPPQPPPLPNQQQHKQYDINELYIGDLPLSFDEDAVRRLLGRYGRIKYLTLRSGRDKVSVSLTAQLPAITGTSASSCS